MEILTTLFLFLIGLVFGSFFNVLIWRLGSEEENKPAWYSGRSICPNCRKQIDWYDNIPVISFLMLSGNCRNCKRKISVRYPIVELSTAFITCFVFYYSPTLFLFYLPIVYSFIVIFWTDLFYEIIPDEMVILGIISTSVLILTSSSLSTFKENVLIGAFFALTLFLIVLATKFKGMGIGDIKLAFMIGLFLGWPLSGVAFWMAFVVGGIASVILLGLNKVRFFGTIALGPFLIIGTTISALWGKILIGYLGF
jgi:leader peptidase (prepilin peptidase)/N-methyltransferase